MERTKTTKEHIVAYICLPLPLGMKPVINRFQPKVSSQRFPDMSCWCSTCTSHAVLGRITATSDSAGIETCFQGCLQDPQHKQEFGHHVSASVLTTLAGDADVPPLHSLALQVYTA